MAKKSSNRQGKSQSKNDSKNGAKGGNKVAAGQHATSLPRLALGLIAVAGLVLTAVLSYGTLAAGALPFCSAGSPCDVVQTSRYSVVLGVPLALWGFLLYALLLALTLLKLSEARRWRWAALLAAAGFGMSIYLGVVSVWVIQAVCPYCTASLVLLFLATAMAMWQLGTIGAGASRVAAAFAAVLAGLLLHGYYLTAGTEMGPEDPYLRALAEHLAATDAKFYGASWCQHCRHQKSLFGPAQKHLPYVECSPNGPKSPSATTCVAAEVQNYPTWQIGEQRFERVMTPKQLAYFSRFPDAEADGGGDSTH